jgi:transcriptional regulator with XRE-family HTH domain
MTTPLLIRELERIARERGWSHRRLASELAMDTTTLSRIRSGRNPLSLGALVQVGVAFGGIPTIRDLMLHYLLIEAPRQQLPRRAAPTPSVYHRLPYLTRWRIRRHLAQQRLQDTPPRGLLLVCDDPALLATAARFVAHTFAEQDAPAVISLRANEKLDRSRLEAATNAALLIIERVEFASATVKTLIHARSDALRPMVITSSKGYESLPDPYLARVFRAWTETITVPALPVTVPVLSAKKSSPHRHAA